ncbi:MAG: transketolase [Caedimonas sp.]|nr:transketolase [Caedimonas sp.]
MALSSPPPLSSRGDQKTRLNTPEMTTALRVLVMDAVENAKSGHPGMPMGMADVATVLYANFLKFDPENPEWPDRDRFVLSAGHGSMLLYALNYLTGYEKMTLEELKNFRRLQSHTAGHPEVNPSLGIETTTGPLGQGLANAVGMAIAEHRLRSEFGEDLVNHRTWVIAGDGCLMEGISHEAISLAGHLKLSRLIVLFDDNEVSIDGKTSLSVSDDSLKRFEASGWATHRINGHCHVEIAAALEAAQSADRPTLIACRTTIGFGAPTKAGSSSVHGSPLGAEEAAKARAFLSWDFPPFEIPASVLGHWRSLGKRGAMAFNTWCHRLQISPQQKEFERRQKGRSGTAWKKVLHAHIEKILVEKPATATRISSGGTLDVLAEVMPELLGGSADLTGSNNTKAGNMLAYSPSNPTGRYIHYGVREHGMAAAMNGIALHGGFIPYGGTFLVFSDYCRPAIRLSALMHQRVIYVLTHDSIGLGEDGPTHQPVEHLAALRAIPNLNVFRPCDAVEVAECWALALESSSTPSILALTRQNLPTLRRENPYVENLSARGGYVLKEAEGDRQITLLATGSEVEIVCKARELLQAQGTPTAVVSMPCTRLFDLQEESYRQQVLGENTLRIACEAAVSQGWDKYIGSSGGFIGMTGFGASAPCQDLYEHFHITPEAVVELALQNRHEYHKQHGRRIEKS